MLPNFLIIGAARSGTTSIYHGLTEHPQVFMPLNKEAHFFSYHFHRGIRWYSNLFSNVSGQLAVGEASVSYTYPEVDKTPSNIASVIPDVRLIYILRNPVERSYSHYLYYRYYSMTEKDNFESAIKKNPIYLGASSYYTQIEKYLKHFNEKQILVLLFEDYRENPYVIMKKIFMFLGVNDLFLPKSIKVKTNSSFKPRNELTGKLYKRFSLSKLRKNLERLLPNQVRPYARNTIRALIGTQNNLPSLSPDTKEKLINYFVPEIDKLECYLKRDLTFWKK